MIQAYTVEELVGPNKPVLKTISGNIKFINSTNGEYYAEWDYIRARIVRPDVECTDGVIHVIDKVMLMRGQIAVGGQDRIIFNPLLIIISISFIFTFWN